MPRRVNVFGQPLSYDVAVRYVDGKPVNRDRLIDPDHDDVSDVTKETVLKYAEDLTHGAEGGLSNANEFPVGGLAGEPLKLETGDGKTPPLSVITNADGQFVEPFTRSGRLLESATNSALSENAPGEPGLITPGDTSFVRKGKSKSGDVDGNKLLSDQTNGDPDPRVIEKYVSPVLKNNRFSPDRTLTSISGEDKKFNPDHPPDGFGSYRQYQKVGTDLPDGVVAEVGPMLSLRATKELNSISRTGYGKDGPDGTGASAASLLPGLAQVGIAKVSADDLQVDSVLQALIAGGADPVNVTAGSSGPRTVIDMTDSYGQMNNVLEQFAGLLPLGMVTAATALSIALNVALRAVLAVFLLITNASNSNSRKRDDVGRFIPGDSRYNPAFDKVSFPPVPLPAKLFGLRETVNPYGDAVGEGIKVFFGGDIGGSLGRVLEAPGFYATFSRTIVRSAADLARILENVGRGNPIQIAENIISFVDAVKSSKVVAVMNMFAQIGDVSLAQQDRLKRFSPDDASRDGDSEIDNLEGLDAMRARKRGSLATAWGAASTKSSLLLPQNVARAMLNGSSLALSNTLSNPDVNVVDANRLDSSQVDVIEKALDAEYLPFYFHDLRTNEIVSFQAFLDNLSEEFAANYDNIDGYGRVDSIKLYRSTNRKIGLSFYVAATNQDDFDAMWVKIDKLTTLLYPQWSAGTLLKTQDRSFVQPFSQVPTASPLVRLRVGDLWTSNYSKFSLARIFGFGNKDRYTATGKNMADANSLVTDIQSKLKTALNPNGSLPIASAWNLEPGDYEAAAQDQGLLGAAASAVAGVASAVGVKTPSNARVTARLRVHTKVRVVKIINSNAYAVQIDPDDADGLPDSVKNSQLLVSRSHLSFRPDTLKSLGVTEADLDAAAIKGDLTIFDDFFSADNNAIVKSFEASKGRGLACVIESMSIDWNNVPWETGLAGSRAPKMCKITMNASVIHDIAPGIDADGFNRAPIYAVGRQANAIAGKDPASTDTSDFTQSMKKVRKSLI